MLPFYPIPQKAKGESVFFNALQPFLYKSYSVYCLLIYRYAHKNKNLVL